MTDFLGFGKEKRRQGNLEILSGRETFRYALSLPFGHSVRNYSLKFLFCSDAFREMLESVSANGHTFEECKEVLKNSASHFLNFFILVVNLCWLSLEKSSLFCVWEDSDGHWRP